MARTQEAIDQAEILMLEDIKKFNAQKQHDLKQEKLFKDHANEMDAAIIKARRDFINWLKEG